MKQFRYLLAITSIMIFGLISCSKTGDTGPAGPQGPAGPDSVIYSNWIPLNFIFNTTDSLFEDTIPAPNITQGILDSGLVLSYIQFTDNNNVTHIVSISSLSSLIEEDFSPGQINIIAFIDLTGYSYRYVVIPGSKKANSTAIKVKGYTPQELKAMTYEQVQQVLADKN